MKKPRLHLIVINKPKINSIDEFGVPEVRRQLLLHLFGPQNMEPALQQTELLWCLMPAIQSRGKKPFDTLPEV
jgi:hypothetical protein